MSTSTTKIKFNESFIRGVTKKWKISRRKGEVHILSVRLNVSSCFILSFTRLTLKTSYGEKLKLMKSLLKKTLSLIFCNQILSSQIPVTPHKLTTSALEMKPNGSSKILSLLLFGRRKNNDYELTCYRRLNLLKERKFFACLGCLIVEAKSAERKSA